MVTVTNTQQLMTFDVVKNVLKANSVLSTRIHDKDYYEYEPNPKSKSFNGFPYIIIKVPAVQSENYLGDFVNNKMFEVEIILRVEYLARGKVTQYGSNIITQLEKSESTFAENGYNLQHVEFEGSEPTVVSQRQVIESNFLLTLQSEVTV